MRFETFGLFDYLGSFMGNLLETFVIPSIVASSLVVGDSGGIGLNL